MPPRSIKITHVKLPPGSPGLKRRAAPKRKGKQSDLEARFADLWAQSGTGPAPLEQFRFDSTRMFRLDFAWPESRVAVEIDGGTLGRGVQCHACKVWVRVRKADGSLGGQARMASGHGTGKGLQADAEKNNRAALLGWAVLHFTSADLRERPGECVKQVADLIQMRASDEQAIRQQSFIGDF